MGDKNAFKDLAKSLTENSSPEAAIKSENDEDEEVLNGSFETGESASSKSYDSSSAKVNKGDEITNGSSSERNDSNKSTSAEFGEKSNSEYDERPAVALVRENEEDLQAQVDTKPKKKKSKAKKDYIASSVVPINIEYKNKPKGYSTSTQYVGDGDGDGDNDYSADFLPMEMEKQEIGQKSSSAKSNAGYDDDEGITDSVSSVSTKSQNDIKKAKDRIAELESEIASIESKSQRYLDENVRIKAQNKVLANDNSVLKEELEGLTRKLSQLESNMKSDSRKIIEERDKLKEKVQALQKEVTGKQEELERISVENTAFIQRIQTLEKEKKAVQQKPVQQQMKLTEDRNRAICAELTVVSLQKNFETDILERALKDARKIVSHLDMIVPKCTLEDAVATRKYQDRFKQIVAKFEVDIEKMKKEFDLQMEMIKNGTHLSTLKRIEPPRPPSPPSMLELKSLPPPNQPSSTRPQMAPINPPNMFSARSTGDIFRPPFMPASNSQPSMPASNSQPSLPPRPLFPPMTQMNGFSFDRLMGPPGVRMPQSSNSPPCGIDNSPSDFNNSGAIPRAQPNAASIAGGHLPARHPMHGDIAPPGLAPSFYFPMPQMNSDSFTSANGIGAPSNESKLFAALNGNLRRNTEPFFKEPSIYQPPVNVESPKRSFPVPPVQSSSSDKEKKPTTKLQGIIDLFLKRFPAARDSDIKEAITVFRSSLPSKSLQGITMNQLKNGLEPILAKKFGLPGFGFLLSNKSEDSTRASSVIDDMSYQQPEHRHHAPHHQPDEEECFICYEAKSDLPLQMLECGHEAHKECLDKWIFDKKTCPICRTWTLPDEEFPRL